MTEPQELSRSLRQIVSDYPYEGEFSESELRQWLRRDHYGAPQTSSHHLEFIGKAGWIEDASLNLKWHYMRCMEEHGTEEAAKEWVFLQGYSVSSRRSHVESIMADLFKAGYTHNLDCIGGSTAKSVVSPDSVFPECETEGPEETPEPVTDSATEEPTKQKEDTLPW